MYLKNRFKEYHQESNNKSVDAQKKRPTKIIENTDEKVCVECQIYLLTTTGRVLVSNGFAEKQRSLNFITKTACLEFCQTTAMGRACAGLGIIGDHNVASAEEIFGAKDESVPDKNIKE